jgi:hypothetical protein
MSEVEQRRFEIRMNRQAEVQNLHNHLVIQITRFCFNTVSTLKLARNTSSGIFYLSNVLSARRHWADDLI